MGFLKGLFGGKSDAATLVAAPLKGICVALSAVSDPAFSEGILGEGVAIKPVDGKIYAPFNGVVSTMFPTGHAVGITSDDGIEILIHFGMDTVQLNGQHFIMHVETDQKVTKGALLIEADVEKIKEAGYDTTTPVVICNSSDYAEVIGLSGMDVAVGDDIIQITK